MFICVTYIWQISLITWPLTYILRVTFIGIVAYMKGLAYNSFEKIKIKRMQMALPIHAEKHEGGNPLYPTLLSYFLLISLVLSKEGQRTSVQMAAQGWSGLDCMDICFWAVHKEMYSFFHWSLQGHARTSPSVYTDTCKIPLGICTITINTPAKKGWERVLQNLNSLWSKSHEERGCILGAEIALPV